MIAVLTGGTGGAKFVDGLRKVVPPRELTFIVNTGDDFEWWGLHISPDVDSITYVLSDLLSKERGWGVDGDTFQCLEAMKRLGEPAWFQIGDRDLSTHLRRTHLLREGKTLCEATAEITKSLGIESTVLPMTNSPRRTGFDRIAYRVRFSISFETSPTPTNIAMKVPNTSIAVRPRLTMTLASFPAVISPKKTALAVISRTKRTRL